jgi:hypothetical protein
MKFAFTNLLESLVHKRSNSNVPADWSQQDRRFGESIKQNLDTLQGLRGDKLDRAVTFRDLLDAGIVKLASGITNFNGLSSSIAIVNEFPDLAIPPAPTNLQASGAFRNIILTWNLKIYNGHSAVQVWRHTSDVISSATMVAQVSGFTGVYADPVGSGKTFYYWVRAINNNDVTGPYNSSSGVQGVTAPDVNFLLTTLTDSITSGQLATSLSTPIAKIDPLETFTGFSSSYSGNSLLTRMGAVETTANGAATSAQFSSEVTTRASADSALSQSITTVSTTLAGNTAAVTAAATSINGLEAQYTVKIDLNGAVAGYGLASTTTASGNIVSEFVVNADRFAIMRGGSNTTAASVPFIVQASATTIGGVAVPAGVYMTDAFIRNGSIINAKIADAAIDNAKIANLDAGKINAGTISTSRLNIDGSTLSSLNGVLQVNELNANKITAGTLSSSRLFLDGVTIDTDGSGRVIIKNLGVDTLQIKGNAVTIPTSAYSSVANGQIAVAVPRSTSYTTLQSLSFTSAGSPALIVASFTANNTSGRSHSVTAVIKKGGTIIYTQKRAVTTGVIHFNISFTDFSTTAGSLTYTLEARNNGGSVNSSSGTNADERSLAVIEVKK